MDYDLIKVPEAARRLGLSERTIRRHIKDRKIPAYRLGRIVLVDWAALMRDMRGAA